MNNNELTHWGILGMRWGHRRYQNKDGSLTAEGKQRRAEFSKAEKEAVIKENILKNPTAKDIYEYRQILDDNELNNAYKRIVLEKNIKGLIPEEKSKVEKFIDDSIKWGTKISALTDTGVKLYGSYEKANALIKKISKDLS